MKNPIETFKTIVAGLLVMGVIIYASMLVAYAFGYPMKFMLAPNQEVYVFALPISAITSFGIVCLLEKFSSSSRKEEDKLEFEAFGLKFSGPAAPVTLWIACYLTLIVSAHIAKL